MSAGREQEATRMAAGRRLSGAKDERGAVTSNEAGQITRLGDV